MTSAPARSTPAMAGDVRSGDWCVLASARVEELGQHLGCRASALQFAATYCGMLTGRITRITDAVHLNDAEAAMDAVLSLKIASNMVGAEAMEHWCLLLQKQLEAGDVAAAGTTTEALETGRTALLVALSELSDEAADVPAGSAPMQDKKPHLLP